MCFCRAFICTLLLATGLLPMSAGAQENNIAAELRSLLREKGMKEGFSREKREIVAWGISSSERDPVIVARSLACARVLAQLKGSTLTAVREAATQADSSDRLSLVVKRLTAGYLTGACEVARVTRIDGAGRMTVALAVRWTFEQELDAVESLSVPRKCEQSLERQIASIAHLPRLAGPQVWVSETGDTWLLGIGVSEVKNTGGAALRNARRLAQLKSRRALMSHLNQYDLNAEVLTKDYGGDSASTSIDVMQIVKNKGVLKGGDGVADVYEGICADAGKNYEVSVCCLSGAGLRDRSDGRRYFAQEN